MRDASPLATRRRKGVAIILTTMSLMVTIPLAGLAVDLSGSYRLSFLALAGLGVIAVACARLAGDARR